jgi:hypothetical protein
VVKKALVVLNNDSDVLLVYNTILSIVFILPLIFLSELQVCVAFLSFLVSLKFLSSKVIASSETLRLSSTWIELTVAGVFGLLINIATYLQISHTSALTHNISGTVKGKDRNTKPLLVCL